VGITHTVFLARRRFESGDATGSSYQYANTYILYPEFGAAMEYGPRAGMFSSGVERLGLCISATKSAVADTAGTLAFPAKKHVEVWWAVQTLYFKTSPQGRPEYLTGTFIQPFVGLRLALVRRNGGKGNLVPQPGRKTPGIS